LVGFLEVEVEVAVVVVEALHLPPLLLPRRLTIHLCIYWVEVYY
jgi:hypothetical protein